MFWMALLMTVSVVGMTYSALSLPLAVIPVAPLLWYTLSIMAFMGGLSGIIFIALTEEHEEGNKRKEPFNEKG